jgi:hypothetical protein
MLVQTEPSLLKRTLVTVAAMVGASVILVGTLTVVASVVVDRAVRPPSATAVDTASSLKPPPTLPKRDRS